MYRFLKGIISQDSRFYLLSLMMFCTVFCQTHLRILKDTIVIAEIGANAIPFIKVFVVVPVVTIILSLYSRVTRILSYKTIYFLSLLIFLSSVVFIAFVFYPNPTLFQQNSSYVDTVVYNNPQYLKWAIKSLYNWGYVSFYIIAEIWPDVFYSVLFWTLLNHIYTVKDAIYSYSLISFLGNLSMILGSFSLHVIIKNFSKNTTIKISAVLICIAGIVSFIAVSTINVKLKKEMQLVYIEDSTSTKPKKVGFIDSLYCIVKSRYLILITLCACSFYCCINLTEFVFRLQLESLNKEDTFSCIAKFLSVCQFFNGVSCLLLNIILASLLKKFGIMKIIGLIPVLVGISGMTFLVASSSSYAAMYFPNFLIPYSLLQVSVIIGAIQNVIAKSTKYSIWDVVKEILYIPLRKYEKTIGKASVDVISSKIGKSIAALLPLVFTFFSDEMKEKTVFVFLVISLIWYFGAKSLRTQYQGIINPKEK